MNTRPDISRSTHRRDLTFLPDEAIVFVQGANRGIGLALVERLLESPGVKRVYAGCRAPENAERLQRLASADDRIELVLADVTDEESLNRAATCVAGSSGQLDLLIICAGLLHEAPRVWPERQLSDVDPEAVDRAFRVNALGPLLMMKSFESLLMRSAGARVATLSARVGSIGDNRLGGWHAYRSSKAALNQLVRTTSIQWARLPRPVLCVALHPGTVRTDLSAPFTGDSYRGRVFDTRQAAAQLLGVLGSLAADDTGGFFAWDGQRIPW
jgi:NAD(P)-dependent dehydrogenase (short-subunit alcohol dehydrogenase family)